MNDDTSKHAAPEPPITEAELHAYADGQLPAERRAEVELFLAADPQARARVAGWQSQNRLLRDWLEPVAREPLPLRLPLQPNRPTRPWRALAAGLALAVVSGGGAWLARGALDARMSVAEAGRQGEAAAAAAEAAFVQRAAIAHAVYTPDAKRPVEVGGDQEQALVTWLTRRLGAPVQAPRLGTLGYELVGGRLLPGGQGPVAQFMYAAADGQRLTLYVSREMARNQPTAFHYTRDGRITTFYWMDERFGYALSGDVDRARLLQVSQEIYKQLH